PESPTREASVDLPEAREPDTLALLALTADGDGAQRPYATPYGSYQGQVPPPGSDRRPPWADEILDAGPFPTGGDEGEPPIWRRYQELVESQVDSELRASVLRAGWLALRGRIGGEA